MLRRLSSVSNAFEYIRCRKTFDDDEAINIDAPQTMKITTKRPSSWYKSKIKRSNKKFHEKKSRVETEALLPISSGSTSDHPTTITITTGEDTESSQRQHDKEDSVQQIQNQSFLKFFFSLSGPPQIVIVCLILAVALGSTIGVVPAVMTDRYARLHYNFEGLKDCYRYHHQEKPVECTYGSEDAQNASAYSSFISEFFVFLTGSIIGSVSDRIGRKPIMLLSIFLSIIPSSILVLMQIFQDITPAFFYGSSAISGMISFNTASLSSIADVVPPIYRAPAFGVSIAGFMLGFAFSPSLSILLGHFGVSVMSLILVTAVYLLLLFGFEETLSDSDREEAWKILRLGEKEEQKSYNEFMDRLHEQKQQHMCDTNNNNKKGIIHGYVVGWKSMLFKIGLFLSRPIKSLSILNRNSLFRYLSALAFLSGICSSADQSLLIYYIEDRIGFTDVDIAHLFMILGFMGIFIQIVVLKPLNDCVGEKKVLMIAFAGGTIQNILYGLAVEKNEILLGAAISSLLAMSFPTISAIKANNVCRTEQGRIQGALFSLSSLASGFGPISLRYVYHLTKDFKYPGPGSMFLFASGLYFVAIIIACNLPEDQTNSHHSNNNENDLQITYEANPPQSRELTSGSVSNDKNYGAIDVDDSTISF